MIPMRFANAPFLSYSYDDTWC